jgi:hypothetical protein
MVRLTARLVAVVLLTAMVGSWPAHAHACPFCGVVGDSLAMRRDAADVAAVGEADGAARTDSDGLLAQVFRIDQVLRGTPPAGTTTATARVDGSVSGTALLFGSAPKGPLRWSAVGANETLLGYTSAAPATSLAPAERLRWFARWLEHPEPAIAADAFTEFGLAPFEAVREAADAFNADRLTAWIDEPGIDARRRGFYGLAAGIVASRSTDDATRGRLREAIEAAIDAPADDFRAGFDGLLGGFLVAEGAAGLDALERRGLFAPTARPLDQRHLLAALRFARESLRDTIPHDRVAAATARLLASPAVAADAAIDLARYGAWAHVDDVARLWETLGREDPLVRRAVAGYLAACPLPAARAHLERLRTAEPGRLDAALKAARGPLAR